MIMVETTVIEHNAIFNSFKRQFLVYGIASVVSTHKPHNVLLKQHAAWPYVSIKNDELVPDLVIFSAK